MPEPLPPPEELRRLTEFVWYLHAIMQAVVQPPHGILRGRHHDVLSAAWAEVKPTFEELARALGAAPPIRQRLGQLGLTGFRLQLELAIFDHARLRLLDHAPEFFVLETPLPVAEPSRSSWSGGSPSAFVRDCSKALRFRSA